MSNIPVGALDRQYQNDYSDLHGENTHIRSERSPDRGGKPVCVQGVLGNATGVSRYGLYGTFGNKRELFEQALDRYSETMGKQAFLRLLEPDASLEHIRKIFRERVSEMCCEDETKGCLFIHTAMELAPKDDDLRDVLQRFMRRMSKLFAVGLDSAKARGEVRDSLDVNAAGDLLTSTMFGLVVLGRSGFSRESLDGIVENTLGAMR